MANHSIRRLSCSGLLSHRRLVSLGVSDSGAWERSPRDFKRPYPQPLEHRSLTSIHCHHSSSSYKEPGSTTNYKERLIQWATTTNEFPWYNGTPKDLRRWFEIVESAFEENKVDKSKWAEAGIMFVSGDLKPVMDERRVRYLERSPERTFWEWQDFKDDIARVVAEGERIRAEAEANPFDIAKDKMARFKRDHPYIAASASVGLTVGGSIVLIPALGIMALNAIGFTAAGVGLGSLAAVLQSILYGGATTGLFSILQSIGATAALPAAGTVIASAGAVGTGIASFFSGRGEETGRKDEAPPPPASSSRVSGRPDGEQ